MLSIFRLAFLTARKKTKVTTTTNLCARSKEETIVRLVSNSFNQEHDRMSGRFSIACSWFCTFQKALHRSCDVLCGRCCGYLAYPYFGQLFRGIMQLWYRLHKSAYRHSRTVCRCSSSARASSLQYTGCQMPLDIGSSSEVLLLQV